MIGESSRKPYYDFHVMDSWIARLVQKRAAERDLADKAALGSSLPEGKLLHCRIGVEFGRIRNQRD